jgi:hypothetical protein
MHPVPIDGRFQPLPISVLEIAWRMMLSVTNGAITALYFPEVGRDP